jgi:hypothetical protein
MINQHFSQRNFFILIAAFTLIGSILFSYEILLSQPFRQRNVIIFVTDGLRPTSVNPTDAPTLHRIRQEGVNFVNSHSLFPTLTTPNASAIATGHYLGDPGDFSNTIYTGFPVPNAGGSVTPFIENDAVLSDLEERFPGQNFLNEEAFLGLARQGRFNTAAVGKLGPVLIQDVTQANRIKGLVPPPTTVIVDDSTGKTGGIPLREDIAAAITNDSYFTQTYVPTYTTSPTVAPSRSNGVDSTAADQSGNNGFSGNNTTAGTKAANIFQQQYFTDVVTRAILPTFKSQGKPFALVYWSRDPDGTQHNQGDSLNSITPGINGSTSKAAVQNVDRNLKQILDTLQSLELDQNTDIFITADHGFSTISKSQVDSAGTLTQSYAATKTYSGVNPGFLPPGFVAIDIAHFLDLPLYDPDTSVAAFNSADGGSVQYAIVKPGEPTTTTQVERPKFGNGVIGGTGAVKGGKTDGLLVVAANGGCDLIYLPNGNPRQTNGKTLAANLVDFLSRQDYASGLFADDSLGELPGALPLSAVNLKGSALTPIPAIAVNFASFPTDPNNPTASGVEIADTVLQQGQGMHGTFSRADTFNNMAAIGPDFKRGFVDRVPVSNADVAITLAHILRLRVKSKGTLIGRVATEALARRSQPVRSASMSVRSAPSPAAKLSRPAANGQQTILNFQIVGKTRYFDAAGFPGRTLGLAS